MKKFINFVATTKLQKLKRHYSTATNLPKMPDFDYIPKVYKGLKYDEITKIREENIVPCIPQYYKKPLLLHEGKMQWLFDHEGKRYLDMFGGISTVSIGHCHPKVTEVAHEQMETLWHSTNIYHHPKLYEYAAELTSTLPSYLSVVYVVNSGSEANDLALFLARLYTGNFEVISFRNGYHGMSPYMMGTTALSTWRYNVPVSFGVHHLNTYGEYLIDLSNYSGSLKCIKDFFVPIPKAMMPDVYRGLWGGKHCRDSIVQTTRECDCSTHCSHCCKASENYYKQLEEVFKYSIPCGHVAALIAESIQGVGGIVHFPKGFLQKAYDLIHTNGGICIADEVQTGFGRTGDHFWGFQMHGVKPDIVTMAKGIGNGFPMAAVVTTPEIAKVLNYSSHFNTFGGNPLACSVGIKVLEVIKEDDLQYNCKVVGTYLIKELAKLREEFECVGDVRGRGLMLGVELVKNKVTVDPLGAADFVEIWEDCKKMGVLLGRGGLNGNVLRLAPPMCITKEDAKFAVEVLRTALQNFYDKNYKY